MSDFALGCVVGLISGAGLMGLILGMVIERMQRQIEE